MQAVPQTPASALWEARFLIALLMPIGAIIHLLDSPQTVGLGALFFWVLIASIDHFMPGAQQSPPPRGDFSLHRAVVRLYVPLQLALLAVAAWTIAGLEASGAATWLSVLGIAFASGWISGAQGITFAHELGHSRAKFDRFLGWVLMTSVWYPHFMVEHYRGHHPRAATFDDPASARRGENVYAFWLRTVSGSFKSAWELEGKRLVQMKKSWAQSPLVWAFGFNIAASIALVAAGLGVVVAAWLACGFIAFSLLELVNYIEHYGLQRQVVDGKREPFNELHAWNANHWLTNAMLANLQRHSDHHTRAWKPFGELQHSPAPAPQLPTGYAGCILVALVPPLWFSIMHRRLDALVEAQPA
jgi:alkane 1-monooxygenase